MQQKMHGVRLGPCEVEMSKRPDGSFIVRSPHALGAFPRTITDRLDHWAREAPDRVFLAQRDGAGKWGTITYAGARALARSIGQALLDRKLSVDRPVAILSGNGLEHALIALGAMYVGVPYAAISPAYSLISSDYGKLRYITELITPGLVFAINGAQFGKAIDAVVPKDIETVVVDAPLSSRPCKVLSELWSTPVTDAVDRANGLVGADTIAKFLFTSGSTGNPKGVVNTQRMMCSNQLMMQVQFPSLMDPPPVLVDWLPWSHTFGGNHNFNLVLMNGGSLYIDDGKPLPGAIETTVRNLKEVAPTVYYNVPKGFEMLLPYLKADKDLARNFFSKVQFLFYAGAALPLHIWKELEDLSEGACGHRVRMITSLGSTETAPSALSVSEKASAPGVIGIPNVGVEMKLVPNAGKLEARLRGPLITPGYWRQPELTAKAFDEEGYYLLGDAFKFQDPGDPEKGFQFDGRVAEDFKLATGTWVSVGPMRARFIAHFAPFVRDVVIAGHDRDDVAALVIPDVDACRALCPGLDKGASAEAVLSSHEVMARFAALLPEFNRNAGGSSFRVERMILMWELPSIDKGEVTDKGSINQRAVLEQRAALVADLYSDKPSARVVPQRKTG